MIAAAVMVAKIATSEVEDNATPGGQRLNQRVVMKVAGSAILAFVLGAIWVPARSAVAAPAEIHLVCDGIATIQKANFYSTNEPSEVLIDITGDSAKIKLPERLAPYPHFGVPEDWRQIRSIRIDATQIEGRFRITFTNPASVSINRMTGHIDITEVGASFSGTCQPYDAKTAVRKF